MARSLGLDIGDKRIGVALSDPSGILASPLTIIECTETKADIDAILAIVKEREVDKIIAGLPRSLNGTIGPQADKVTLFVEELNRHTSVPVLFRDERLSTVSARRLMRENQTKRNREKVRDDAVAAAIILQSFLDESLT